MIEESISYPLSTLISEKLFLFCLLLQICLMISLTSLKEKVEFVIGNIPGWSLLC